MKNLRTARNFALSFTSFVISSLAVIALISALAACGKQSISTASARGSFPKAAKKTMRSFASEDELKAYLKQIAEERKREAQRATKNGAADNMAPPAPATGLAQASEATKSKDESITNTQHADVDEGGIVKLHGDHLVVLRRGRLFTVAIGDNSLKPISTVDAFGPDIEPSGTWYDEMLVSDDTVVVIGYSYARGGTEVGLFNIDHSGNLSYRSTYHLRSNDYYSSRNYASRLIGSKLIFYSPLYLNPYGDDPYAQFPAVRKWHKGATAGEFQRIVSATHVYIPEKRPNTSYGLALHTVTVCDLGNDDFKCDATAVLGAPGRVFYVSPESVYVWTTEWSGYGQRSGQHSVLYP